MATQKDFKEKRPILMPNQTFYQVDEDIAFKMSSAQENIQDSVSKNKRKLSHAKFVMRDFRFTYSVTI